MKTTKFFIFIVFLIFVSCNINENRLQEKVSFEIYETLAQNDVPYNLLEELMKINILLDTDTLSPIIAYVHIDSILHFSRVVNDNVKFLKTAQPVDKEKKYFAIVAVKNQPDLNNSDIKKTKQNQKNVEIYFNLEGAIKWAVLTKNNIGKLIAFAIDNEIYTLPSISGEIKNGRAIVNGLDNEDTAIEISNSI